MSGPFEAHVIWRTFLDTVLKQTVERALGIANGASDKIFLRPLERSAGRLAYAVCLPAHFVQQLFAIEDKRFAYHIGVDFIALLRAAIYNLGSSPRRPHGASTITQQIYSGAARLNGRYSSTVRFKLAQQLWAIWATTTRSKADVLKEYLESVYFGRSLRGLKEASWEYCQRDPQHLNPAESFFLAERIARPNRVSPKRIEILVKRRPIAEILTRSPCAAGSLVDLYERHFRCGEVVALCLEKHLRSPVARTYSYLEVVSNEQ
jgi:membrane carboxypeptidase/penicillin-binding protein PbpC